MTTKQLQQIVVPAYVWADEAQRVAVLTRTAQAMLQVVERDGFEIVSDVGDATVTPTFLKAVVGESDGVRFVAYELCDMPDADLVFVTVEQEIGQRA